MNDRPTLDEIRARCALPVTEIVANPGEYYRVQTILRDRAELLRLLDERTAERDSWRSAREDLAEANKRLCAALERIVAQDDIALTEEGYREGFANVVRIARKALHPDWTTFYTRSGVEVCPQCTTPTTCKTLGCLPPPRCDI